MALEAGDEVGRCWAFADNVKQRLLSVVAVAAGRGLNEARCRTTIIGYRATYDLCVKMRNQSVIGGTTR